jgi:hypothetical protein
VNSEERRAKDPPECTNSRCTLLHSETYRFYSKFAGILIGAFALARLRKIVPSAYCPGREAETRRLCPLLRRFGTASNFLRKKRLPARGQTLQ